MEDFDQLKKHKENQKIQRWVLLAGLVLLFLKFYAWWITNSNSILTDALESIINVTAGSFALFSLYLAAKPRDRNHPYGHGKIEFISAGLEGGLILMAGLSMIGKGIYNFIIPHSIHQLELGIIIAFVAGLINFVLGFSLERTGKRNQSLILIADGKHLKTDAYSSVGLVLGLLLVRTTDLYWIDNLIAIIFGIFILITGYKLLRASTAGIMDAADNTLIEDMVKVLEENRSENWIDAHNFRVIKYGATLHVDCHLTLPWYFELKEAHDEVKKFEQKIADACKVPTELFIHSDPCRPSFSCTICTKSACPERQKPFEKRLKWRRRNLVENKHH
ncbi:MAG: cation transporter [Bacteroidetes bacterium]|nr:cation transporter [Bacteroidota bacterium]